MAKNKLPRGKKEESRRLKELIEHPLQPLYNDGLNENAFKAFAADVKRELREKIQILPENAAGLPANTILDGHKRRRALLHNGETTTTVIVRYDLASADARTIEKEFLQFNAHREHRDLLLQARTALRLYEIEKNKPLNRQFVDDVREARDRVGQAIGMSGRNLNRYFRVLRTPLEVQNAFRVGELPLVVAEKVADLDERDQKTVAKRIRAGEDPRELIREYLPQSKSEKKADSPFQRLLCALQQGRAELAHRTHEVKGGLFGTVLPELRKGRELIDALIAQMERNRRESSKILKQVKTAVAHDEEE